MSAVSLEVKWQSPKVRYIISSHDFRKILHTRCFFYHVPFTILCICVWRVSECVCIHASVHVCVYVCVCVCVCVCLHTTLSALQVVDALLKKNVSGDITIAGGETPLTYAVEKHSVDMLNVLVKGTDECRGDWAVKKKKCVLSCICV